jgi:hypothetical protein
MSKQGNFFLPARRDVSSGPVWVRSQSRMDIRADYRHRMPVGLDRCIAFTRAIRPPDEEMLQDAKRATREVRHG